MKKIIIKIGTLLILIGIIIIGYRFIIDLLNFKKMNKLSDQFINEIHNNIENNKIENNKIANNKNKNIIAILEFPKFKDKIAVIEGVELNKLTFSAGHFPETPFPWDKYGNSAFAAHNDTFFKNIKKFNIGDEILVYSKNGNFHYTVTEKKIVNSNDTSVLDNVYGYKKLTLITCTFTGAKRIVIFSEGGEKI